MKTCNLCWKNRYRNIQPEWEHRDAAPTPPPTRGASVAPNPVPGQGTNLHIHPRACRSTWAARSRTSHACAPGHLPQPPCRWQSFCHCQRGARLVAGTAALKALDLGVRACQGDFALQARMAVKMKNGFAIFSLAALRLFIASRICRTPAPGTLLLFPALRAHQTPAKGCPKRWLPMRSGSWKLGKKGPLGTAEWQQELKKSHKVPTCSSVRAGPSPF